MFLKKQTAFAGIEPDGRIMCWAVAGMASEVRREIGKAFNEFDSDAGWNEAKKTGVRVKKISMTVSG